MHELKNWQILLRITDADRKRTVEFCENHGLKLGRFFPSAALKMIQMIEEEEIRIGDVI